MKAGKAVIRLVIHQHVTDARTDAARAAEEITDLLNAGYEYFGPKTLHFDWSRRHLNVKDYFARPAMEQLPND